MNQSELQRFASLCHLAWTKGLVIVEADSDVHARRMRRKFYRLRESFTGTDALAYAYLSFEIVGASIRILNTYTHYNVSAHQGPEPKEVPNVSASSECTLPQGDRLDDKS